MKYMTYLLTNHFKQLNSYLSWMFHASHNEDVFSGWVPLGSEIRQPSPSMVVVTYGVFQFYVI